MDEVVSIYIYLLKLFCWWILTNSIIIRETKDISAGLSRGLKSDFELDFVRQWFIACLFISFLWIIC